MTQADQSSAPTATPEAATSGSRRTHTGKRVGYGIAIAVNGLMLLVANNILEWEWFPWLTEDWNDVLPLVTFSIVATMVVNLVYILFDEAWFKSLTQAILTGISLFVTVRVYQVFPFDFSGYEFDWETLTRAILVLAMIGLTISLVVETVKFVAAVARRTSTTAPED